MLQDGFISLIDRNDLSSHKIIRNMPEVQRYLRQVGDCTEENQIIWYNKLIEDITRRIFSIKVDSKVVGSCCLLGIDHYKGYAEAGWFIDPRFQRKGYAKVAVKSMLDFAFSSLNLHSVYAFVYSDNEKGIAFVEKIGFKKVGILRERRNRGTHYVDEIIYDLLSRDFYEIVEC